MIEHTLAELNNSWPKSVTSDIINTHNIKSTHIWNKILNKMMIKNWGCLGSEVCSFLAIWTTVVSGGCCQFFVVVRLQLTALKNVVLRRCRLLLLVLLLLLVVVMRVMMMLWVFATLSDGNIGNIVVSHGAGSRRPLLFPVFTETKISHPGNITSRSTFQWFVRIS